jgi:lipopolysaccharide export system protein LptA
MYLQPSRTSRASAAARKRCAAAALLVALAAAAGAKSPDLILKSANRNLNTMHNDEIISTLEGNVVFLYDDAVIKSDYAKWWKSRGTVHFANRVHVTKKEQDLRCDRLDYDKSKKWLVADGNVDFFDGKERTRIRGRHADYYPDSKFIKLTGKPEFFNYDTSAHDTLAIQGDTMAYSDSVKMAHVHRDVSIVKGKLFSTCGKARYFTEKNKTQLRATPRIQFEHDSLSGDSIDLMFTKRSLQGMSVGGNAHGMYKDFSPKDTVLTQVFGDSIYMGLDDSGRVDSLWIYRNVKSSRYPVSNPSVSDEAYGKIMIVNFTKKGDVDNVRVWGNAKSVYHVVEGDKGCNIATGDSIAVEFSKGKASRVVLAGSVRGYYAPEKGQGNKKHE